MLITAVYSRIKNVNIWFPKFKKQGYSMEERFWLLVLGFVFPGGTALFCTVSTIGWRKCRYNWPCPMRKWNLKKKNHKSFVSDIKCQMLSDPHVDVPDVWKMGCKFPFFLSCFSTGCKKPCTRVLCPKKASSAKRHAPYCLQCLRITNHCASHRAADPHLVTLKAAPPTVN